MKWKTGLIAIALAASPAVAQHMTSADEVRPILSHTKSRWVSVREYDGHDLLYFTNLLSYRCGIDRITYAVNGKAEVALDAEPCYMDEAVPNAQKADGYLPFLSFPLGSVKGVSVSVFYDDGSKDSASYKRNAILIE